MIDSLRPAHHSRARHPRVVVASEITPDLAEKLNSAARAFYSNRSKLIAACIETGLPLVVAKATAALAATQVADQQQQG